MNEGLVFQDTCEIYDPSVDGYGSPVVGSPLATIPCMLVQTTTSTHASSQDSIEGTPRLALPNHQFLIDHAYRLEEMIVQVNPFGNTGAAQTFKIVSVTPARDLLLANEVHHVECDLKKIEVESYVS